MPNVVIGIRRNVEFNEFRVTQTIDGVTEEKNTFFTDDKEDAVGTAIVEAERWRARGDSVVSFTKTAQTMIAKLEPGFQL